MGLAQVLGLSVGRTLALALPTGRELRLRVAGIVSSLEHDGRVAYVPAAALLADDPSAPDQLAVRVDPGASVAAVSAAISRLGARASPTRGIAGGSAALISALQALLRVVAAVDALVCLYTLLQALALTASERRSAIALLRACGARAVSLRALLAGAALAVLAPAAVVGIALERLLLGPAIAHIAAGYAALALGADTGEIALLLVGLALLAAGAVGWVAGRAMARPVTRGLA
jgi:ABC-type lipoprotein release transport system permease subunit